VFLVAVGACLTSACATPSSRITLPECVERVAVDGQHARSGRTLILNHDFDLPGTRTRLELHHADGSVEERVLVNTVPEYWRLLGGTAVAVVGAGLATRYAVALLDGEDPLRSEWFWTVPVGGAAVGVGAALALTGWHPPADTTLEGRCAESP
jgi:hypothetical protein